MAKRLTEKQKEELVASFISGKSVYVLSKEFQCTELTIIRNLKKIIGEIKYNQLKNINKNKNNVTLNKKNILNKVDAIETNNKFSSKDSYNNKSDEIQNRGDFAPPSSFMEITPIDCDIENSTRKELTSVPISEINLPDTVFMIVDNNIELEIKYLKDYPEWDFLPSEDLERKTIEIYFDIKSAKRSCSKAQKVIKVPNTNVFKIAAPFLISKGISRIVSTETLIAL